MSRRTRLGYAFDGLSFDGEIARLIIKELQVFGDFHVMTQFRQPVGTGSVPAAGVTLARDLLMCRDVSMNSNRMRVYGGVSRMAPLFGWESTSEPVDLNEIPAPVPIRKPSPERIVRDILLSTLERVKQGGSAEIAAAASEFAALIETKSP